MHAELAHFFDSHRATTQTHKRAVHEQLVPVFRVAAEVDAHIAELQAQLTLAELAPHAQGLDHKMEWMHTRLRATSGAAATLRAAARDLAKVLVEVENGFTVDLEQIRTYEAALAAAPTPSAPDPDASPSAVA
jgi:hypothetical protein